MDKDSYEKDSQRKHIGSSNLDVMFERGDFESNIQSYRIAEETAENGQSVLN